MANTVQINDQMQGNYLYGGSGGGAGLTLSGETPTGTMNGVNDTFTLSVALDAAITTWGFYNVQLIIEDVDYTRTGDTIVLTTIRPNAADSDTLNIFG